MEQTVKAQEWDAWERRNPGVQHPDRIKDRARRQKEEHEKEFGRLHRKPQTLAQIAMESRGTVRRDDSWVDNDYPYPF